MGEVYTVAPTADGLVDLLDRVVHRGAVLTGDVIISLAGIDLIRLDLRLLLSSIDTVLDTVADTVTDTGTNTAPEGGTP
jgi:hypothetical protein